MAVVSISSPDFGRSRYQRDVQNSQHSDVVPVPSVDPGPSNRQLICSTISGALRWKNRQLFEAALSQDLALSRGSLAAALENRWAVKSRSEKLLIGIFGTENDELNAAEMAVTQSNAMVEDGHKLADLLIACEIWKDE